MYTLTLSTWSCGPNSDRETLMLETLSSLEAREKEKLFAINDGSSDSRVGLKIGPLCSK